MDPPPYQQFTTPQSLPPDLTREQQQQMVFCPVKVVYDAQIILPPDADIRPNEVIYLNSPQNLNLVYIYQNGRLCQLQTNGHAQYPLSNNVLQRAPGIESIPNRYQQTGSYRGFPHNNHQNLPRMSHNNVNQNFTSIQMPSPRFANSPFLPPLPVNNNYNNTNFPRKCPPWLMKRNVPETSQNVYNTATNNLTVCNIERDTKRKINQTVINISSDETKNIKFNNSSEIRVISPMNDAVPNTKKESRNVKEEFDRKLFVENTMNSFTPNNETKKLELNVQRKQNNFNSTEMVNMPIINKAKVGHTESEIIPNNEYSAILQNTNVGLLEKTKTNHHTMDNEKNTNLNEATIVKPIKQYYESQVIGLNDTTKTQHKQNNNGINSNHIVNMSNTINMENVEYTTIEIIPNKKYSTSLQNTEAGLLEKTKSDNHAIDNEKNTNLNETTEEKPMKKYYESQEEPNDNTNAQRKQNDNGVNSNIVNMPNTTDMENVEQTKTEIIPSNKCSTSLQNTEAALLEITKADNLSIDNEKNTNLNEATVVNPTKQYYGSQVIEPNDTTKTQRIQNNNGVNSNIVNMPNTTDMENVEQTKTEIIPSNKCSTSLQNTEAALLEITKADNLSIDNEKNTNLNEATVVNPTKQYYGSQVIEPSDTTKTQRKQNNNGINSNDIIYMPNTINMEHVEHTKTEIIPNNQYNNISNVKTQLTKSNGTKETSADAFIENEYKKVNKIITHKQETNSNMAVVNTKTATEILNDNFTKLDTYSNISVKTSTKIVNKRGMNDTKIKKVPEDSKNTTKINKKMKLNITHYNIVGCKQLENSSALPINTVLDNETFFKKRRIATKPRKILNTHTINNKTNLFFDLKQNETTDIFTQTETKGVRKGNQEKFQNVVTDKNENKVTEKSINMNMKVIRNNKDVKMRGKHKDFENRFILTHVIEGVVIQESNFPFSISAPRTIRTNFSKSHNALKETTHRTQANRMSSKSEFQDKNTEMASLFHGLTSDVVKGWDTDRLVAHFQHLGMKEMADLFQDHELDGEALTLVKPIQLQTVGIEENMATQICMFMANENCVSF